MKLISNFKVLLYTIGSLNFCCAISNLDAAPVHGYSLYGNLKYPADFKHYDYANPNAPKAGTLRLAALGTFDSLNPFIIKGTPAAGLPPLYASNVHATLGDHATDELLSEYGYIAESFELAPDRSWLICHLRREAKFHDDSPIQADDVIYSFQILTTKGNPLYRNYYKDVKSVKKIDDVTVKFTFATTQNLELPFIVNDMPILSKRYWSQREFDKADLTIPVGSGPYKIIEVKPGNSITYERIRNWWGENLPVNKGRYNYERIRYDYYRDDAIMFEAFKSGAIDFRIENKASNWATAYNFPAVKRGQVIKEEVQFEHVAPTAGLVFNTRRDIFKNNAIRRAMTLCYDFEWLNKNYFYNLYTRSNSYFSDSELAATGKLSAAELALIGTLQSPIDRHVIDHEFKLPITDGSGFIRSQLAEASKILNQAGYKTIKGQLLDPLTQRPIEIKILLNDAKQERATQNFVKNLHKLGIKAILQVVDHAQYTLWVADFDYDMIHMNIPQSLTPGNEQREFWHSSSAKAVGSCNTAGIANPAIDEVIEKLINAPDRQSIVTAIKVLDRLLLWGYYMIPTYYQKNIHVAYNRKLKHPAQFPRYSIDQAAWWIDDNDAKP